MAYSTSTGDNCKPMSNGDDSKGPTKIRENVLDVRDYVLVDEILISKIN